jgi:hypothetical protein
VKHWRIVAAIAFLGAALGLKGDAITPRHSPAAMTGAPRLVLWAWEEPEDLRGLNPHRVGVAFLADRVFLDSDLRALPRRQRIRVPEDVWAEAVVRIEAGRTFKDSDSLRERTTSILLQAAALPHVRSLQVDFDATRSQQPFYANVLRRVHERLPDGMGLSMTALVSWCSVQGGWMNGLPVDEAVPMYFRLGKHTGWWTVREPLCRRSLGVATDEPWMAPDFVDGKRVYIFAPLPWTEDQVTLANHNRFPVDLSGETKGGQ